MRYLLIFTLLAGICAHAYTPVEPTFANVLKPQLAAAKQALLGLVNKIKGVPQKAQTAAESVVKQAVTSVSRAIDGATGLVIKAASKNPAIQAQARQLADSAKRAVISVGTSAQSALASGKEKADQVASKANQQLQTILNNTETKLAQLYDKILNAGEPSFN